MIVGFLIVIYFPVMFSSSKGYTPTDTPAPRRPFSSLDLLDQQLYTSVPPLGRAVQAVSVRMLYPLSRYGPWGEAIPGEFNFEVVMGEGG